MMQAPNLWWPQSVSSTDANMFLRLDCILEYWRGLD